MNLRVLRVLIVLFVSLTTSALAGLEIKKARYGNTTTYHDVTGIVTAYVRNNTLSFLVSARSMGGDPGMGTDFLFVVYSVNGHEFTDTVPQGQVFTFRGIPNVYPVQPPMSLPFLKPIAPATARLYLINHTSRPMRAYNVDRFGQWVWATNVERGLTIAVQARLGEQWVIADNSNRIFGRKRIARGDNLLAADQPEPPQPSGGYRQSNGPGY